MSDSYIEQSICNAIQIIADKKLAEANFDKTYIGIVDKIVDQVTGEYKVKYQDSVITAYATSPDIHYRLGQEIYFLVPSNNMARMKTIIGGVDQNATTYKEIVPDIEKYNKKGTNLISNFDQESGRLTSYKDQIVTLYEKNPKEGQINHLDIDINAINRYIKQGNGLSLGMVVKTSLADSQVGGDYGVGFLLKFKDAQGGAAVRPYVVSSTDVIGNPYSLLSPTLVETFRNDIDTESFESIQQIYIYNNGFPLDAEKGQTIFDIFISDIQVYAGTSLTEKELDGYSLNIDTSTNGDIIGEENASSVKLIAQLKVKGKIVTKDVQYLWFRQNGLVYRGSQKYSGYAGDGWEALNPFARAAIIFYDDPDFTFTSDSEDKPDKRQAYANQKVNKILCVAIYENQWIKSQIEIINNYISSDIVITSTDKISENTPKTIYYMNNGSPTLECEADFEGVDSEKLVYTWTVIPNRGQAELIKDRIPNNDERNSNYDIYSAAHNHNEEFANTLSESDKIAYWERHKDEENSWKIYKDIERVNGKFYYNFPISSITGFSKITCAVSEKQDNGSQIYRGSASIILYNKMEMQGMYSLNLEYGTQVFQYDGKGNSPASLQIEKPLEIKPLTFTLIDNAGKEIPYSQIIQYGEVKWIIPNTQTLLISLEKGSFIPGEVDLVVTRADLPLAAKCYNVYENLPSFAYSIADRYDAKKNINYIWLYVKYKDMSFDTYTDFTFPKDGDPGTNGTDYVAKIEPSNGTTDRVYISSQAPTVMFNDQGQIVDKLEFKLYNNSVLLKDAKTDLWSITPKAETTKPLTYLQWLNKDRPSAEGAKVELINTSLIWDEFTNDAAPAHIIRAQWNEPKNVNNPLSYFAEFPICTNFIKAPTGNYRFKIKPKTGFKYVVYSQDGSSPNYDNTLPFELIVEKAELVDGVYYYQVQNAELYDYEWKELGNISISLKEENKATVVPNLTFDGQNRGSAIMCRIRAKADDTIIGFIHVPIYMIINRYNNRALNGWDGNSLLLNQDGTGEILTPQIGAGKKDKENTFTGILMGQLSTTASEDSGIGQNGDVGLMGYNQGQRSIFLDAQTGSATFGKQGKSQIKIDASNGQGTIQSGDYNYSPGTENGKGMKIKFSSSGEEEGEERGPYIRYGSGRFTVDWKGNITAKGGGEIAGWTISDATLQKGQVGMNSDSQNQSYNPNADPNDKSLDVGDNGNMAFWAGDGSGTNKNFFVTHKGYLFSKSGKIASWNIDKDSLSNGTVGMGIGKTISRNTFYNQTANEDARIWSGNNDGITFAVTADGKLYAKQGNIGGWEITKNSLQYFKPGETSISSMGMGNSTASKYPLNIWDKVKINGKTSRSQVTIANPVFWSNNNFAISRDGRFYAAKGRIGSWFIDDEMLWATNVNLIDKPTKKISGIVLNSDGSMYGGEGQPIIGGKTRKITVKDTKYTIQKQDKQKIWTGPEKIVTPQQYEKSYESEGWLIKAVTNGTKTVSEVTGLGSGSWSINPDGEATFDCLFATGGKIGNWVINDGAITNQFATLTKEGTIEAIGGTIGGFSISPGAISGGSLILNSNGSIEGGNWRINSDGTATFSLKNQTTFGSGGISAGGGSFTAGGSGGSIGGNPFTSDGLTLKSGSIGGNPYTQKLLTLNTANTKIGGHSIKWSDPKRFLSATSTSMTTQYVWGFSESEQQSISVKVSGSIDGSKFTDSTGKACSGEATFTASGTIKVTPTGIKLYDLGVLTIEGTEGYRYLRKSTEGE